MKKIIELAEKVVDLWGQPEEEKVVNQLAFAIIERQELEQTPITEGWLKEHGWEVFEGYGDIYYKDFDTKRIECTRNLVGIGIIIYGEGISSSLTGLRSVANLYDACELCGITID